MTCDIRFTFDFKDEIHLNGQNRLWYGTILSQNLSYHANGKPWTLKSWMPMYWTIKSWVCIKIRQYLNSKSWMSKSKCSDGGRFDRSYIEYAKYKVVAVFYFSIIYQKRIYSALSDVVFHNKLGDFFYLDSTVNSRT